MDQNDWVRVIDHSNYYCRSTQRLWIHTRVVRYIRIVGTNNTVNKCFHTVSLEIMYNTKEINLVDIEKGLVCEYNNKYVKIRNVCNPYLLLYEL